VDRDVKGVRHAGAPLGSSWCPAGAYAPGVHGVSGTSRWVASIALSLRSTGAGAAAARRPAGGFRRVCTRPGGCCAARAARGTP
jgi:hypothetical protein